MKKIFEMPSVEIRSFECENIATNGSSPDQTAYDKAVQDLQNKGVNSTFNLKVVL